MSPRAKAAIVCLARHGVDVENGFRRALDSLASASSENSEPHAGYDEAASVRRPKSAAFIAPQIQQSFRQELRSRHSAYRRNVLESAAEPVFRAAQKSLFVAGFSAPDRCW